MNVKIGNKLVGDGEPIFVVAEIGINANGDLLLAKKLIDMAVEAKCDAVKFQKRTIEKVYTREELETPRKSPWGETNREQKYGLEFNRSQYKSITRYCESNDIMWFASCWDKESVDFIAQFNPPCYKIASACLTDDRLLQYTASKDKPIILSTGMSTLKQIEHACGVLRGASVDELIILHCTSTYPSKLEELNLNVIQQLKKIYPMTPIGYSGHETGVSSSVVAGALGACLIERHITLDRSMYGSDQAASLEPRGLQVLVRDLKEIPLILGDGIKKVYDSELPIIKKLRK